MDAEMLGIAIALETGNTTVALVSTVALDSQGAIERATQLHYEPARSWIEHRIQIQLTRSPRALVWVKGHSGVEGSVDERVDEGHRQKRRWPL